MPAIDLTHPPSWLTTSSVQEQLDSILPWLVKRRGSSGGGGRGGGSSSSSSGSKGSSSSSGSGSSGSKGSPPAYSPGSAPPPYSVSGGSAIAGTGARSGTSAGLSGAQKSGVFGSSPAAQSYGRGRGAYGYGGPALGAGFLLPVYGFWPIAWYHGRNVNDTSRPGGALTSAGLTAPNDAEHTYVLYGDSQSVSALIPALNANCNAANASAPADLSTNTTLETYRDDSFELYRFPNVTTATPVNATFEGCLNSTIGDNLLIASGAMGAVGAPFILAGLVAMATGFHLV